jgi:hypothetical protein
MSIETILPLDPDGSQATSKFLLGRFTILYVIQGQVTVLVDGDKKEMKLNTGQTIVCEREDDSGPTDLTLMPVDSEAVVLAIQLRAFKSERVESQENTPLLCPTVTKQVRSSSFGEFQLNETNNWEWGSVQNYRPPIFSRIINEHDVPPPTVFDTLDISALPLGSISTCWINMVKAGLSEWIRIPVIVARGVAPGPVVGITAVVHGNELNGVKCIHRVVGEIDVKGLKGTVVAVPCVIIFFLII